MKKPARTLLWVLLDALLVNASLFLAQVVRYSSNISYSFFENSIRLAPAMTVIFLLVFCGLGMYRTMWQYASASDVLRIALATLAASVLTYLFSLAANAFVRPENLFRLHRMVYLLLWIVSMAAVGGSRLLYRILVTHERLALLRAPSEERLRAFVRADDLLANARLQFPQPGFFFPVGKCVGPHAVARGDGGGYGHTIFPPSLPEKGPPVLRQPPLARCVVSDRATTS